MQTHIPSFADSFVDCLFHQSPYPMWISDDRGTLVRINPACKALLNLTDEEVVGLYNILEDDVVRDQGLLPIVRRVYEAGETVRFEIRYDSSMVRHLRLSRHAFVILDVTIFPIRDDAGTVRNAVIQHVDITSTRLAEEALQRAKAELEVRVEERTADLVAANNALMREMAERKLVEEELRSSSDQFRTLCEAAPVGIYRCSSDGAILFANGRLRRMADIGDEDPVAEAWVRAIHPEDRSRIQKAWDDALANGRRFFARYRLVTPTRREVHVRSLAMPIGQDYGHPSGFVGIVEDVTEIYRAREEMLRAQKLESLGVLAGGIAHDFNNILMVILGYMSVVRTRLEEPKAVRAGLDAAEKAVLRAKDLTQQLITFARGGDPVKKVVRLRGLIEEATLFATTGSTVQCVFNVADDLAPVEADEGQLSQVIHNLVINAAQAMPEGGTIEVSGRNLLSSGGAPDAVEIRFRDHGIGIAPQHRDRIFDPYFTTKQQGSGLGLASCFSIIRKHGGTIDVESTLGEGSTFTVTLPATTRIPVKSTGGAPSPRNGSGRILLMDDDPAILDIGLTMLTELGYVAEGVRDGAEAVAVYRRAGESGIPFTAVIMDLTVPGGMGGTEALGHLLQADPEVKAVVSSGYSDDSVLANCRTYGFRSVLAKPYTLGELRAVLDGLLLVDVPASTPG